MSLQTRSLRRDLINMLCLTVLLIILGWSIFSNYLLGHPPSELQAVGKALRANDLGAARTLCDRFLSGKAPAPESYLAICHEFQQQKQWGLLIEYAERGVKACKDAPAPARAALQSMLAIGYSQTEERPQAKALKAAAAAQKLDPKNPEMLNLLGYTLVDNAQDLDRAQTLLTEALRLVQDQSDTPEKAVHLCFIEDSYGWLLYQKGEYAEAVDALTQAIAHIPEGMFGGEDLKFFYLHLGSSYHKLHRFNEARRALRIALFYDPGFKPAKAEQNALPPVYPPPQGAAPPTQDSSAFTPLSNFTPVSNIVPPTR